MQLADIKVGEAYGWSQWLERGRSQYKSLIKFEVTGFEQDRVRTAYSAARRFRNVTFVTGLLHRTEGAPVEFRTESRSIIEPWSAFVERRSVDVERLAKYEQEKAERAKRTEPFVAEVEARYAEVIGKPIEWGYKGRETAVRTGKIEMAVGDLRKLLGL